MRGFAIVVSLLLIVSAMPFVSGALVTDENVVRLGPGTKIAASDAAAGDRFGGEVAISDGNLLVGAPGNDDNGSNSGSAYLYQPDGSGSWTETKFTATDGSEDDGFGAHVAIDGARILIGAPANEDVFGPPTENPGSAYLYQPDGNGGWTETKFTASDGNPADRFGTAVSISGDNILIGAHHDDDNGSNSGSAYLYQPDDNGGWTETKFTASDGAVGGNFGGDVALDGDSILIGALGGRDRGAYSGSAYLYQPDGSGGWAETKFTASDGVYDDRFGVSVGISGGNILVGSYGDDDEGARSGSAYLYRPSPIGGWEETKFTATDGAARDLFGVRVAIHGDQILVAATGDDEHGQSTGAAYLYRPDDIGGWTQTKFLAGDGAAYDYFGTGIAIHDQTVIIGASGDDDDGPNSGSVYVTPLAGTNPDRVGDLLHGIAGPLLSPEPDDSDADGDCFDDDREVAKGSDPNDASSIPVAVRSVNLGEVVLPVDAPGKPTCYPHLRSQVIEAVR